MGIRGAARRLDGLLGRAVYRATVPADDVIALGNRLESAVRTRYEPDGFAVHVDEQFGSWFLNAHRGLTAGFGVGLIPDSSTGREAHLLIGVGRTSRLDEHAGWLAGGIAVIAASLTVLAVVAAGGPLPGPALVAIAFGVLFIVLVGAYQFLIPAVASVEFLGGGRLSRDEMSAVVEVVRGVVEAPAPR